MYSRQKSLFTSIAHDNGLTAISKFISGTRTSHSDTDHAIHLLKMIRSSNILVINGQLYMLLIGAAMGTPVYPTYVGLDVDAVK
ncbi:hypothetical protein GJ496_004889 [Pomphorhynchus laevis]|nr:hypothetical protein GJ496_004889 [Pomphorhynchus laevis]